jgi:hypothetical protein
MDGKEPITTAQDIQDAMETIRAIEFMGFALEETSFKPRWFAAINKSMDILRHIHDDLIARLPPEVIEAERAKSQSPQARPPVQTKIILPTDVPTPNGVD